MVALYVDSDGTAYSFERSYDGHRKSFCRRDGLRDCLLISMPRSDRSRRKLAVKENL
jgi:hypothetical protein